ncbi:uncharacterized protein [Arachis hypogaea]|uniref:uncharacterized protein isoform X1 n=1 Tax=Arachis hypogaea TaxID=3818 RepID=UPI0011057122|nr:uncharacterized protein LOC112766177 isoform X2 [Arachis hypogaea]
MLCLQCAVFAMVKAAFDAIDFGLHSGTHPRLGVVDHICFHPLVGASLDQAATAARSLATKTGSTLQEQHMKKGGRLIQSEEHLVISSQMPIKTDGPAQVTPAKEKMQIKTQAEDKASQSIFLEAEAWTLPSFFPANYKCCADFLKWVFMMMLQIFGGGSSSS